MNVPIETSCSRGIIHTFNVDSANGAIAFATCAECMGLCHLELNLVDFGDLGNKTKNKRRIAQIATCDGKYPEDVTSIVEQVARETQGWWAGFIRRRNR
jgi:hypothetical protein